MSEFKVGDWVKMKDDSSAWMGKVAAIEYKPCFDSKWNRYEIEILVFEDGTKLGSGWAIHVVKAVDHRIDMPSLPEPVGSLQELHPEFAKVLHENFLELLGDKSHIENRIGRIDKPSNSGELETLDHEENHISPNCKVEDV